MDEVTWPVRVLAECGVTDLVLTNAAGAINRNYRPGEFMLFSDHINFIGANPLRGITNDNRRFVDLSHTYSPRLSQLFLNAARQEKIPLHQGVYLGVSGPTYETPAEIRAFARLGADAVGMSTVPEAIMARYCGMEVAALSCLTNAAAGFSAHRLSHQHVLAAAESSSRKAVALLRAFAGEYEGKAGTPTRRKRS
jgi:purine-nucleoside phosphorylase